MRVPATAPCGSPIPLLCTAGQCTGAEEEPAEIHNHYNEFPPPFPLTLSFNNLTYSIKIPRRRCQLISRFCCSKGQETKVVVLDDISGEANEGEILAVLGPSGSGKTTLIDALANRIVKGKLKGTVNLKGQQPLDSNNNFDHKSMSAYVMQDDLLFPMLTVEETLTFAAELKLSNTLHSKSAKRKRVLDLIEQLDLKSAAGTVIGDETHRGISGGERRRVSIGIEIITNPFLLFLDEPTTGLDSTSSYAVVKILRRIAQSGRSIVVMSVHQPSSRLLGLFNRLLFLSYGRVVYYGTPSDLSVYLSDFGQPVPEDQNPSEATLDLISDLQEQDKNNNNTSGTHSNYGTLKLVQFHKLRHNIYTTTSPTTKPIINFVTNTDNYKNPWWKEVIVLLRRAFLNSSRSPEILMNRFGATLATALIFSTTYWKLNYSPKENEERRLFMGMTATTIFFVCAEGWGNFLLERNIVIRETSFNNSYRKISYLLAHALSWLPSMIFLSIILSVISFWGVGLRGGFSGFLFHWGIIFASFWAGNSYVTLIVELVPGLLSGFCVIMATLTYFLFFSGLYMSRDRIPDYWKWFNYLSPVKYPYQAMLQNEYGGDGVVTVGCVVTVIQSLDSMPLLKSAGVELKKKFLENVGVMVGMNMTGSSCSVTGEEYLKAFGITDLSKWGSLWVTVAWGFVFRVLYYIALLRPNTHKRN